ncbi:beta-ketoacyl-ACP synthase II [Bacteroidales bacterium OttesenSCG-928-K03]|nr:beta-ketoacyl-ACP synthase II [Odoribacter sp. OttesenSCG-928-L07]MDL2241014.1 beta-ketoacyl-ACP synthase II [Bacteroidales bacterium OttesenSCG-928-K22]MDL2242199.1 beta-ketoacyl-ACP synthase II [Bacteroidales bacterium OttesenSCG-928-K03]
MALNRVVVTGYGALTPLGNTANDFWHGLVNGVSGANDITYFDPAKFKTRFACELKNFDPTQYFDKKELRKLDPFVLYGLVSANEAVKHSKLQFDKLNKDRCGVIWGSGIGGVDTLTSEVYDFVTGDGTPRFSPYLITKMIIDIVAGQIAIKYDFKGINYATVAACASSAVAIIDAYHNIQLGKADVIIAGGSEAPINPVGVGGFNSITALSTRNDDFVTASRPFDKDRDGFVIGEGAGALILESYDHAIKRKATIYAEIVGSGISCDASHITAPDPEGNGAFKAMQSALNDAKIKADEIDYINAHGTSTPLGDIAELYAIKKLFKDNQRLAISSTKSMTGHLLGAAGAVEAIASIMSIQHSCMPATINHFTDDPAIEELNLNIIYNKAKKRKTNLAMTNAFGFGGHNTSIIFKKI